MNLKNCQRLVNLLNPSRAFATANIFKHIKNESLNELTTLLLFSAEKMFKGEMDERSMRYGILIGVAIAQCSSMEEFDSMIERIKLMVMEMEKKQ